MDTIKILHLDNFEIYKRKTYLVVGKEEDSYAYRTIVTLRTSEGRKYRGESKITHEDAKYFSSIAGFQIAERRAYMEYLNERIYSMEYTKRYFNRCLKWTMLSDNLSNKEIRRMKFKIGELRKAIKTARKALTANYKKIDTIVKDTWKAKDKINKRLGQNTEN